MPDPKFWPQCSWAQTAELSLNAQTSIIFHLVPPVAKTEEFCWINKAILRAPQSCDLLGLNEEGMEEGIEMVVIRMASADSDWV